MRSRIAPFTTSEKKKKNRTTGRKRKADMADIPRISRKFEQASRLLAQSTPGNSVEWVRMAMGGGQRVAASRATTSDPPASPGIATPSPERLLSIAFPPTCRPLLQILYLHRGHLLSTLPPPPLVPLESSVILFCYHFIAAATGSSVRCSSCLALSTGTLQDFDCNWLLFSNLR